MISRDAAAADMCNEGCFTELVQSKARANVPNDRETTKNWSICRSVKRFHCGLHVHTNVSRSESLSIAITVPIVVTVETVVDDFISTLFSSSSWLNSTDSSLRSSFIISPLIVFVVFGSLPLPRLYTGFGGTSAWYLWPTRISPLSARSVFWTGSNTRQ